jgi:stage IV sporulation protein FB
MGWSLTIGKFGETKVRLHWSFLLFIAWIASLYFVRAGAAAAIGGTIFLVLLFACVVLHEFGHILAARHFGVKTPEVLLLPIGGVSRLEHFPEEPRQELVIALAGPAVSLVIGLGLLLLLGFPPFALSSEGTNLRTVFGQLGWINLFLAGFNLLPAFPMDGGRVLRALLASRFGYARGTRIAASAGQVAAAVFGLLGLVSGNVILVLIALFVFLAAGGEAGVAQMRNASLGLTAADVMITEFESLRADQPISEAAELLIRTNQHEFPVVDGKGVLRGGLARADIIKALHRDPATPVLDAMQSSVPVVTANLNADQLVRHLEERAPMVVVTGADGRPAGIVTWDNMLELMMIEKARARPSAGLG